ncbi:hypothetical protein A6M14_02470 [Acinetobacter sp. Ac_877]|uniref:hypothetical protein n=1 Tax=Acinetobacter portensis TaxID=1839785 RepID=UPI00128DACF1|nr:hypothetical protein [Acinetobacter portensis]MPW42738.1 hypothetical protein [Acinetobacter portensis]
MILDFDQFKKEQFLAVASKIKASPHLYLNFDTVADFYQAHFLDEFPRGTTLSATGLDDGAEQFYAVIEFKDLVIKISKTDFVEITVNWV